MKHILLLAYAISPIRGSEFSVSWNHISQLSRYYKFTVLYGLAGDFMGDFSELDSSQDNNFSSNVKFIKVEPNFLSLLLNFPNKYGIVPFMFYFAYKNWHKQAYKYAQKIIENENIDLIHYINPIGYREPGYMWKFDKPYIWGPIGGITNFKKPFFQKKNLFTKVKFYIRNFVNYFQFNFNPRLNKAVKNTNILMASTFEQKKILDKKFSRNTIYLPENSILKAKSNKKIYKGDTLNILWIGTFIERKGLDILLSALKKIKNQNFILNVYGTGKLKKKYEKYIRESNLTNKIFFHGHVKRKILDKAFNDSHVFVITSHKEENPTVIWESWSNSVPVISFNNSGMSDLIDDSSGILIDYECRHQLEFDLSKSISSIIENPRILNDLTEQLVYKRKKYLWSARIKTISKIYENTTNNTYL